MIVKDSFMFKLQEWVDETQKGEIGQVSLGYVGCKVVLTSLGHCPLEFQIQLPWR